MTTYTITTAQNIDELTGKTGSDVYNVNGGTLTIDQDSRYGLNQSTSASMSAITLSSTLGGTVEIDARYVRLIPFNSGSGNVPASNTLITQGGASGKLIGVYASLTSAPTAAASAMPASGYIKVKQWNGTHYAAGALTGLTANATGVDVAGWIELVGDVAGTITVPRLGLFRMRGDWYDLGTTTGANTGTYQLPTNGLTAGIYCPGVWVETAVGSDTYEMYPCAGSLTATAATMATDDRGKVCWVGATTGIVRFGHDGTNSTGGYVPGAGRKVRVPNIFTANCITSTRTANTLPNATLATRFEFAATGGRVIIDKACVAWFANFAQSYSLSLSYMGTFEQLAISELATPLALSHVGVGQCAAHAQFALNMTLCLNGGTISDCVWTSATLATSGRYVNSLTGVKGITFTRDKSFALVARANATTGNTTMTAVSFCNWVDSTFGVGRLLFSICNDLKFTNSRYWDHPVTTTATANPMSMFDLGSTCVNFTIDGIHFGGLTRMQPYTAVLNIGAASYANNIKLRNLGTYEAPLDMGSARQDLVAWTRATTTATATKTAHGLKVGDPFYVIVSSDTAAITVASKTVASVPTADTFTFTCLNAGAASGTLSYYPTITGTLVSLAANSGASNVKVQRCYTPHLRSNLNTEDNSAKGITYEAVMADYVNAPVSAASNMRHKLAFATHAMTAQTNPVYGTHWADVITGDNSPNPTGVSWARTTTTATVTLNGHKLRTGEQIWVTVTSDAAAIVTGAKTITATTANAFTFTCLNAGATSGTLTFENMNGRIVLLMNETSPETTSQVTLETAASSFTAAGGLVLPSVGDAAVFEMPGDTGLATGSGGYVLGHTSFMPVDPVMAGGTNTNYETYYQIDLNNGAGWSDWENLAYSRAGGSGTSGAFTFSVTNVTGMVVGDYVWGTGLAANAKITDITGSTITVDKANTATVSGNIRFGYFPNEVIDPDKGFKLKIRIRNRNANTNAITSYYIFTRTTDASRAKQYVLETNSVTFTGLPTGTDVVILSAGTTTVLAQTDSNPGTSYSYVYSGAQTVDVGFIKPGYVPFYIRNLALTTTDSTIPVALTADRNFV